MPAETAIGLMSGTSLDGVDACAVAFDPAPRLLARVNLPFPDALAHALRWLATAEGTPPDDPIECLGAARRDLTDLYAEAVAALPSEARSDAELIGAHGQTIRHRPEAGFTLQILDGARLAILTGRPVVCDFRSADLALGGQGAPLVPAFHLAAFGHLPGRSAVVNIGGIANVTVVDGEARSLVAGFDTGPGNRLLDDWIALDRGEPFDRNGAWAAGGHVDAGLLLHLRQHPYFGRPAPKSTGREAFNLAWLRARLAERTPAPARDVQATLGELTAATIAEAVAPYGIARVIVCGGGAFNGDLLDRLGRHLAPLPCWRSDEIAAIDPQAVEAMAFAWMARERWHGRSAAAPACTGAREAAILGAVHLPPPAPGAGGRISADPPAAST